MTDAPAQHPVPLPTSVADVMHPPVTTVNQNDHVAAAAYLMKRAGTTALIVTQAQAMIASDVKVDTRKLNTYEEFEASAQDLKTFAATRRAFILSYGQQK